ncbi:hypothetical protein HU200_038800 [Digitaria exilis]|uniref:Uncharacterized protein n=1 Tax=Digitaria exilis TaxID=1010633 RepID=A0A835ELC1_9POAL|nr:hypothetical protein HU200_038800 [Digitaria exilis]
MDGACVNGNRRRLGLQRVVAGGSTWLDPPGAAQRLWLAQVTSLVCWFDGGGIRRRGSNGMKSNLGGGSVVDIVSIGGEVALLAISTATLGTSPERGVVAGEARPPRTREESDGG